MKYCGKCGSANNDEMRFCCECGAELQALAPAGNSGIVSERKAPLYETKVIQVDNTPSVINASNEAWAMFGWSVQSVQVTHSQDTRTYTKDFADYYLGTKTVETTTINYATITYQRDKNMPNYHEIAKLEHEYDAIKSHQSNLWYANQPTPMNYTLLAAGIIFGIWPGILYYLYKKKQENEATTKYAAICSSREYQNMKNREEEIVRAVSMLM